MARHDDLSRTQKFEKHLRQLEKITRISDRYQTMLQDLNAQLVQASTHDLLTGLANRRLLAERLKQEAGRASRQEAPLCLALADLDNFKQINDSWGHDVGDEVLCAVASGIQGALRDYDLCGRWGGEEFLLLLPQTRQQEAAMAMGRVIEAVRALRPPGLPAEHPVRVSIGVTEYAPDERPEDAVSRADAALLQAKREGRDRVVVAAPNALQRSAPQSGGASADCP
jgi:diguanylate cyclase (GGDEF)-like protein